MSYLYSKGACKLKLQISIFVTGRIYLNLHKKKRKLLQENYWIYLKFHFVSQFTVETYCFADGQCLFNQPQSFIYHCNQYDEI